jgi:uncharacterized YigZ family protein
VKIKSIAIAIIDTYLTLDHAKGDILYKDKGSKFIGYAFPINDENDVKTHVEDLKKKHHSARHWCYAWRLGIAQISYRVNDDGEPNNSAGQPIYGQILSKNITNVLLVVVRYFGGTKLGLSGLINAYKTTAKWTLDESVIIERTLNVNFQVLFDYENMNKVMRIVKENNLEILTQNMELKCEFLIAVRMKNAGKIESSFKDLRCLKILEIKK